MSGAGLAQRISIGGSDLPSEFDAQSNVIVAVDAQSNVIVAVGVAGRFAATAQVGGR